MPISGIRKDPDGSIQLSEGYFVTVGNFGTTRVVFTNSVRERARKFENPVSEADGSASVGGALRVPEEPGR